MAGMAAGKVGKGNRWFCSPHSGEPFNVLLAATLGRRYWKDTTPHCFGFGKRAKFAKCSWTAWVGGCRAVRHLSPCLLAAGIGCRHPPGNICMSFVYRAFQRRSDGEAVPPGNKGRGRLLTCMPLPRKGGVTSGMRVIGDTGCDRHGRRRI